MADWQERKANDEERKKHEKWRKEELERLQK